jgi:peptidoglycan hydrolase CwlO-like protein
VADWGRDLQQQADRSIEMLGLFSQITGLVQRNLGQLSETAEHLLLELQQADLHLAGLRAQRAELERELERLRLERDSLRHDLERLVEHGLERRRELAAEIEQLEQAKQQHQRQTPPSPPATSGNPATPVFARSPTAPDRPRRAWWRFWSA